MIIIAIFLSSTIYSYENIYFGIGDDSFKSIRFMKGNKVEFLNDDADGQEPFWNQVYNYSISELSSFYVLNLSKETKKYDLLILVSYSYLVVYEKNSDIIFYGTSKKGTERFYEISKIKGSSELEESGKRYAAQNLCTLRSDFPWVEAANGCGIGEYLDFSINASEIIVFLGYVSIKNPDLYRYNCRPRVVEIEFLKTHEKKIFELEDTPNPQSLQLGQLYNDDVRLKILDVYKGDKYDDLCINSIMLKY